MAAATLLPTGLASASGYGGGDVRQVPGVTTVIDTSHAEHDVSVLFSDYFGTDNLTKSRLPADQFPKDFKESLSGGTAARGIRSVSNSLNAALRNGDGAAAASLFASDAVFEDMPAHVQLLGPRSIGAYLTSAAGIRSTAAISW